MSLQPAYRVSVQVPPEHVQAVQDGICAVEPLRGGHYDRVLWIDAVGEEQFRPLPGANPAYGSIGEVAKVASVRLVFTLPRDPQRLARVIRAAQVRENMVIGLNSIWGGGKSSVLNMALAWLMAMERSGLDRYAASERDERDALDALMNGVEPAKAKGGKLAQRAGILCEELGFRRFLADRTGRQHVLSPEEAKQVIYSACGVTSRAHLDHDDRAARCFHELDTEYSAWRLVA